MDNSIPLPSMGEKSLPEPKQTPPLIYPPRKPVPAVSKETINPTITSISDTDTESAKPLPSLPVVAGPGRFVLPVWVSRWLPEDKTYLGLRRNSFLLCLFCALVFVFMLILGVSIGVSVGRKSSSKNGGYVPLPTTGQIFTGDGTYYNPALGACGINSTNGDFVGAVSWIVWDAVQVGMNPNENALCGRKARATRYRTELSPPANASVEVIIIDRCTGCEATDLDLSLIAFEEIAAEGLGRVVISWAWIDE